MKSQWTTISADQEKRFTEFAAHKALIGSSLELFQYLLQYLILMLLYFLMIQEWFAFQSQKFLIFVFAYRLTFRKRCCAD